MRMRLLAIVSALLVMAVALPLTASAAAPNTARLSATSYTDTAGSETNPLCDPEALTESIINAVVSYSGVGPELGGTGTGDLVITILGETFTVTGELTIDGQPAFISGEGELACFTSGYAMVSGVFTASGEEIVTPPVGTLALEPGEVVCGDMFGYIMDGVHQNQGRVSLTLSGSTEGCEVLPPPPPTI